MFCLFCSFARLHHIFLCDVSSWYRLDVLLLWKCSFSKFIVFYLSFQVKLMKSVDYEVTTVIYMFMRMKRIYFLFCVRSILKVNESKFMVINQYTWILITFNLLLFANAFLYISCLPTRRQLSIITLFFV